VRIDWHEDELTGIKVYIIEEDASRKLLGELLEIITDNSMLILNRIIEDYLRALSLGNQSWTMAVNSVFTKFMKLYLEH
jgi:hypothetical protein